MPFSTDHRTDHPISLYGATKKNNEILAYYYSSQFNIETFGIRFFTVERLASKLAMSKKTIYKFFPKKEVLIKKIIEYRMGKMKLEFQSIIKNESDPIIQFVKIRNYNIQFGRK